MIKWCLTIAFGSRAMAHKPVLFVLLLAVIGARLTHVAAAARKIAAFKARFVSRDDMSGTDAAQQRLWAEAAGPPTAAHDLWYTKTGASMEQSLTTAASTIGDALTDRSTWLRFPIAATWNGGARS